MTKITSQHTYFFVDTGESVTVFVSNTMQGLRFALALNHKTKSDKLNWTGHYEGILQIQSKINLLIWYIYLSAYWDSGMQSIPIERVMMVKDCNSHHNKH